MKVLDRRLPEKRPYTLKFYLFIRRGRKLVTNRRHMLKSFFNFFHFYLKYFLIFITWLNHTRQKRMGKEGEFCFLLVDLNFIISF